MFDKRASGILLHPTSLPSSFGIGDLGESAYNFVDFLAASSQQVWQILPIGPTGYGNSPYLSYSALAGNPLLISPEKLKEDNLLTEEDFNSLPDYPLDRVDYDLVIATKIPLLAKASNCFKQQATSEQLQEFQQFCDRHNEWLDDYALFMAVKEAHNGASWNTWDAKIAQREPEAMVEWSTRLQDTIFYHKFLQYQFFLSVDRIKTICQ